MSDRAVLFFLAGVFLISALLWTSVGWWWLALPSAFAAGGFYRGALDV